jgi:hypothetical protein
MRIDIKLTGRLYNKIIRDLARPHPFAAERVGFVFGRVGLLADEGSLIHLTRYHSIPDDQYVDDPSVGARIGSEALTWTMQTLYFGRATREGIFHIHMHQHKGETRMSRIDSGDISKLIPGFQSVSSEAAHGIIILSMNHGSGWVWLPARKEPIPANTMSVIGVPVGIFERRITK